MHSTAACRGLLLAAALPGCSDPPDPAPTSDPEGIPRWSTAPHVQWSGPETELSRPLAVLVDESGGPLDLIAADSDVTTFLNDRFHPWFIAPEGVDGMTAGTHLFLDLDGCLLIPVEPVQSASAWIDQANSAIQTMEKKQYRGPLQPTPEWNFELRPDHPLFGYCQP